MRDFSKSILNYFAAFIELQVLNNRLKSTNPIDLPEAFRADVNQHYNFLILHPEEFNNWFARLRTGLLAFDLKLPEQNKD